MTIHLFLNEVAKGFLKASLNPDDLVAGGVLISPHGTPQFSPFRKGVVYVASSDVLYERYDPFTTPNPYDIPKEDPEEIQYFQMYRTVPEKPENYFQVLERQIEEIRKKSSYCPVPEITTDTLCIDIWKVVFSHLEPQVIIQFGSTSRGFLEMISSESFWKDKLLALCTNIDKFPLSRYPTWRKKFQALYDPFQIEMGRWPLNECVGTVIDIGTLQTKYFLFDIKSKSFEFKILPSVFDCEGPYTPYREIRGFVLGKGEKPLVKTDDLVNWICNPKNVPKWAPNANGDSACLLLCHREDLIPPAYSFRICRISVAALSACNSYSGIVVSLGYRAWIEVVLYQKTTWGYSLPKLGNIKKDLDTLLFKLEFWLESYNLWETIKSYEFCCIGGLFDDDALKMFLELLSQKNISKYKPSIISKVEERVYGPLMGVFLNSSTCVGYRLP